jgi:translation initiation factor 6
MNSHGAVVPSFCTKDEVALLKSHGLSVFTLPAGFSAAGNNIAANDSGAVVNPEFPRSVVKSISDCLGVEAVPMAVAGYVTAGSCVIATNKGFAAHNRATDADLSRLKSILHVNGLNCTLDTGVAFVSLCGAANSKGALIGESSTGFEAGRIAEALGLF